MERHPMDIWLNDKWIERVLDDFERDAGVTPIPEDQASLSCQVLNVKMFDKVINGIGGLAEVHDNKLYIKALFTVEAISSFQEVQDRTTCADFIQLKNCVLVLTKYFIMTDIPQNIEKSEIAICVESFYMNGFDIDPGIRRYALQNVHDHPNVRRGIRRMWRDRWAPDEPDTCPEPLSEESDEERSMLSLLLEAMKESSQSQPEPPESEPSEDLRILLPAGAVVEFEVDGDSTGHLDSEEAFASVVEAVKRNLIIGGEQLPVAQSRDQGNHLDSQDISAGKASRHQQNQSDVFSFMDLAECEIPDDAMEKLLNIEEWRPGYIPPYSEPVASSSPMEDVRFLTEPSDGGQVPGPDSSDAVAVEAVDDMVDASCLDTASREAEKDEVTSCSIAEFSQDAIEILCNCLTPVEEGSQEKLLEQTQESDDNLSDALLAVSYKMQDKDADKDQQVDQAVPQGPPVIHCQLPETSQGHTVESQVEGVLIGQKQSSDNPSQSPRLLIAERSRSETSQVTSKSHQIEACQTLQTRTECVFAKDALSDAVCDRNEDGQTSMKIGEVHRFVSELPEENQRWEEPNDMPESQMLEDVTHQRSKRRKLSFDLTASSGKVARNSNKVAIGSEGTGNGTGVNQTTGNSYKGDKSSEDANVDTVIDETAENSLKVAMSSNKVARSSEATDKDTEEDQTAGNSCKVSRCSNKVVRSLEGTNDKTVVKRAEDPSGIHLTKASSQIPGRQPSECAANAMGNTETSNRQSSKLLSGGQTGGGESALISGTSNQTSSASTSRTVKRNLVPSVSVIPRNRTMPNKSTRTMASTWRPITKLRSPTIPSSIPTPIHSLTSHQPPKKHLPESSSSKSTDGPLDTSETDHRDDDRNRLTKLKVEEHIIDWCASYFASLRKV